MTSGNSSLYLALDGTDLPACHDMARLVNDVPGNFGFKLNQDVLMSDGIGRVLKEFQPYGRPLFADIKMWNGGRTMEATIANIAEAGAALTNIYVHAGAKALTRALKGAAGSDLMVFGVGVLTHYTDDDCYALYGVSLSEMVKRLGLMAKDAGLPGYIMPGTCLESMADVDIKKLIPAVRPLWFEDKKANAQEQTVTPIEAFVGGAQIVVCGSPVFRSDDPCAALERLLEEITCKQ